MLGDACTFDKVNITKMWNCYFLMILTFTFDVYFTEGLKWKTEPLPVNKCKGQTAHFTWEYIKEPHEEITQLQWIFNTTVLIAYSSMNQGFNVEPNYQGRVNQSGENGIWLHNISSKDIGDYTLYPLIKWDESPNIQTVQLNVIEPALEQNCSCAKLSDFPKERNGESYKIAVGSCNFEISSSFCCPVGLVIQYCVDDPLKFCTSISNSYNVTKNITQSIIVTPEEDPAGKNDLYVDLLKQKKTMNAVLGISIVCMLVMFIIMGILFRVCWFLRLMNSKTLKKIIISTSASEENPTSPLQRHDVDYEKHKWGCFN
ncbi:hypothetical protein ACJMK2_026175 [Sinanodonta woodiana]|uniref:Uncharacterized protein n=1 Tax=Sinanodonta woodiana TaxID=1069815 RepID=A0ABD3XKL0_SINWO